MIRTATQYSLRTPSRPCSCQSTPLSMMSEIVVKSVIPTLRVTAIEASLPLYRALGFGVAWEHRLSPDAPRLTCIRQGAIELFLTEHAVAPAGAVAYFVIQGLDALVTRAAEAGHYPTFGPEDRPWGDREAYFRDPDGNVLRFGEQRRKGR
jgi:catechol 2,3-dioxygenase-like lactoylglutathione lyase family enzyme